jgi:hypothetical protein
MVLNTALPSKLSDIAAKELTEQSMRELWYCITCYYDDENDRSWLRM